MAAGCLIVRSKTRPGEEVIEHGINGLLTVFYSPDLIAEHTAGGWQQAHRWISFADGPARL
jgi:hypothetical protein